MKIMMTIKISYVHGDVWLMRYDDEMRVRYYEVLKNVVELSAMECVRARKTSHVLMIVNVLQESFVI